MPFLPNNYPTSLVAASALTALAGGGCLLAAATAYHTVRQHIRATDGLPVATLPGGHAVPPSFSSSATVRELVNHADHKLTQDSRSVELRIPRRRDRDGGLGVSSGAIGDEEILARFVRGFFGGVVLAPERAVLRMLRVRMTCFSSKLNSTVPIAQVRNRARLLALSLTDFLAFFVLLHRSAHRVVHLEQGRAV